MQKYHGFDQQFADFLFQKIIQDGGLRMQLIASELVKYLQEKHDAKSPLNLFRKQYGNIFQALKALPAHFFILDNMVIRMKPPSQIRKLKLREDLMEKYEKKVAENQKKEIQIMKINNQNVCIKCEEGYNVYVNKAGHCGKGGKHEPKH